LVRAPRYRGRVPPCPALRNETRPTPVRTRSGPKSLLRSLIPCPRPVGVVISFPHRYRIDPAHPTVQVDVAASARAERPELLQRGLAADRAGFVGSERRAVHGEKIGRQRQDGSAVRSASGLRRRPIQARARRQLRPAPAGRS